MDEPIEISWYFFGDTAIVSDVEHNTVISLDLEGWVAEASADAEASGDAVYTFAATETNSVQTDDGGWANSNAYSISQVQADEDDGDGGGGGGGGE